MKRRHPRAGLRARALRGSTTVSPRSAPAPLQDTPADIRTHVPRVPAASAGGSGVAGGRTRNILASCGHVPTTARTIVDVLSPVVRAESQWQEWGRSMLATGCPHHAGRFECAGCAPPERVSVETTARRVTASPTSSCSECGHPRYAHTDASACHTNGCACERFHLQAARRNARPQTRSEDTKRSSPNPPVVLL